MHPIVDEVFLHPAVTISMQLRALGALHRRVEQTRASGREPVVEIDLDLCALQPRFRTMEALRRVGNELEIPEFLEPEQLPFLPGYSDEAWLVFILELGLPSRHPSHIWIEAGRAVRPPGSPFARFHELYWAVDWLIEDEPTAGLGLLVHTLESAGGRVVFLSGRWLAEHKQPSLECLKRAGIPNPELVIGNPWHETLVPAGQTRLSDAELKAWRQDEIGRRYGIPVAIVDDRPGNRLAVDTANGGGLLRVAIAIPGFSADPSVYESEYRISTFEDFSQTIDSAPVRPHLQTRYPSAGSGSPWTGLYAGIGRNGRPYQLPRLLQRNAGIEGSPPFARVTGEFEAGSATEEGWIDIWRTTIPEDEQRAMREALLAAEALGDRGIAAPFPKTKEDRESLWLSLICAWLHSRDLEVLMRALGYPLKAAGIHDLREYVSADEVRRLVLPSLPPDQVRATKSRYSVWLIRWAQSLGHEAVNIGFLNPALLTDLCLWNPDPTRTQDAMDVHRLSDHHEGDQGERFDPLEAAINNLLHQREGRYGVRKELVSSWAELQAQVRTETGATNLAKNSAGRQAVRDAAALAPGLEAAGWLTPWTVCEAGQIRLSTPDSEARTRFL